MEEILTNPFMASLAVLIGGLALVAGGELLVRGATKIALGLRVPPLIVGLTIVALCTSAPEMAVSFSSVLRGDPSVADVALGNVVGSNICNILLILGVCAIIRPLASPEAIVKRDAPVNVVLALVTLVVVFLTRNPAGGFALPRSFGFALLLAFVVYEIVLIRQARREQAAQNGDVAEKTDPTSNDNSNTVRVNWLLAIVQTLLGLLLLIVGARGFVDGAVSIARTLHVSELVIGLTLVAIGTSLPELTVSAVATFRNQVDVALGNVIGSNVCNLMLVLGGTLALSPGDMPVQNQSAYVDLPVMLAASAIAAWFCLTGRKLERWEGALLLAGEIGYAAYLVL